MKVTLPKTVLLWVAFILLSIASSDTIVAAEDRHPTEIPLSRVWAWEMPGTKDVRDLEPNREKFKKMGARELRIRSLAVNTYSRLNPNFKPMNKKKGSLGFAGLGFVVDATGVEALKEANLVLKGSKDRQEQFEAGSDLTLFFYAYGSSRFVRIDEVVKGKNRIIVKYHFDSHGMRVTTQHYALIPLGNDLQGNVKVTIKRLEDTRSTPLNSHLPPYSVKEARQLVCESFDFAVLPPPE